MDRAGKCLCGAATFMARGTSSNATACHCGMCLGWAGGPWISVFVESIDWTNDDTVAVYASSTWAERGFCTRCGSSLFYRITAEGKHKGITSVSFGCLEDRSQVVLSKEWFIDRKPDAYEFAGEHPTITEAEAMAMLDDVG